MNYADHHTSQLEWGRFPWLMLACIFILTQLGLTCITRGDVLAGSGNFADKQVLWLIIAPIVMTMAATFHYRILKPISLVLFVLNLLLMFVLFLFPAVNGARSWFKIGAFMFQPSELTKISYILVVAQYLMYKQNSHHLTGLIVPFVITAIPLGMILLEPDLGTALLLIPILFSMLFVAGARSRHLLQIVCMGLCLVPVAWSVMNSEQKSRVTSLFHQQDGGLPPRGDGYHLYQSKSVLAQGGVWGSYWPEQAENAAVNNDTIESESSQIQLVSHQEINAVAPEKNYHLPAARTDFICCLVGERFGLVGVLSMIFVYIVLFWRMLVIAAGTREPFGRLVVTGVVILLASQVVINTGMTVGLMPITGLTLPLLSYGGSSMLGTSLALGLVINIALRPGYEISGEPFRHRK
jgi:cell division protein FtsW (lipid II flippase)